MNVKTDHLRPEDATKHGTWARDGVLMKCRVCPCKGDCEHFTEGGVCEPERSYVAERREVLLSQQGIDRVLDGPAVDLAVWSEARILRAARYMAATGELQPGATEGYAELTPLATKLPMLVNSWRHQLESLALTPAARARRGYGNEVSALARALQALPALPPASSDVVILDGEVTSNDGD